MNVVATVGAMALATGLACSLFAIGAAVVGHFAGRNALVLAAQRAIVAVALLTTFAVGILAYALLTDDFSIAHVAEVSSRDMLPQMKWASLYSGEAGSLLFWTWLMSLFMGAFAWLTVPRITWGRPHAIAVCGTLLTAFLIALVFMASPFRVSAVTPPDGVGLNPLLVDPTMLIHPPFMLAGLVSTSIPFSIGAAALLSGRLDRSWITAVRHWALLSWLVLSIGNILGAFWAYTVLGWGGYWGWDPVENSALLPLLPMTAFVHSMMVQERRGTLKLWNLSLVFAAFALAVFGTFNVRSGLVSSVHSFALSPIGPYFLLLLGITLIVSIALLVWRSSELRPDGGIESLASRESALIVNNYLFAVIALIVFGGTLFPVFSELLQGSRITVAPPFYNDVVGPLLIVLVALMTVGMVLPWRGASRVTLVRRARMPLLVLVVALVLLATLGVRDPFALLGISTAVMLMYTVVREFAIGARATRRAHRTGVLGAVLGLFDRDRRRYGGYLVHLGIAVMAVAVVGSNIYQEQVRVTVAPNESFEVGRYTLTYEGLVAREGTSNGIETEIFARIGVARGDERVATVEPGRRFFRNFPGRPMAIVGLNSNLREDLYIFLEGANEQGLAEINVFVNPLMAWLWIGAVVYVTGGLIAFMPQRVPVPARDPAAAADGVQRA